MINYFEELWIQAETWPTFIITLFHEGVISSLENEIVS